MEPTEPSQPDQSKNTPVRAQTGRQRRGEALYQLGIFRVVDDTTTVWGSATDRTRNYRVEREQRNRGGVLMMRYRCSCVDFKKVGTVDCKHIVAEKRRRGEIGPPPPDPSLEPDAYVQKPARPKRKRLGADGRTVETLQRIATGRMEERVLELILSLVAAFIRFEAGTNAATLPKGRPPTSLIVQVQALLYKAFYGLSSAAMTCKYERLIETGALDLRMASSEGTLSRWINDARLEYILRWLLELTMKPFVDRETFGIIDSSKVSQMETAHARRVEYDTKDLRPGAIWAKKHVMVGAETQVVMGVQFSGSVGKGSHDINFFKMLMDDASKHFNLKTVAADKAYLSQEMADYADQRDIAYLVPDKKEQKPVIRGKSNVIAGNETATARIHAAGGHDELYRFRVKVESYFAKFKGELNGYLNARGAYVRRELNATDPCVAWKNELLLKTIVMNLRTTVSIECETSVKVNYLVPTRRFPPPKDPIDGNAAA